VPEVINKSFVKLLIFLSKAKNTLYLFLNHSSQINLREKGVKSRNTENPRTIGEVYFFT